MSEDAYDLQVKLVKKEKYDGGLKKLQVTENCNYYFCIHFFCYYFNII